MADEAKPKKLRRGANNRKRVAADDIAELERVKRRAEAFRMRTLEGASVRTIAKALNVCIYTVSRDLMKAREECKPENLDELRKIASEALEHIRDEMIERVGDPQCASAAIKAIAEHAKLNGLHAPVKTELSVESTTLAHLFAELERR